MKKKYVILDTDDRNAVFYWSETNGDWNNPIKVRVTSSKTIFKGSNGAKLVFNRIIALRDADIYKLGTLFNRWKTYTIKDLCWRD